MAFVHPELAILGAGLALVPIVIHLLHRRRFVSRPWAAMDFVLAAYQRTRRRLHLEQWVLLAVRVLVIGLLGLVAARPFLRSGSLPGGVGRPRMARAIIIDNSFSMRARREDGITSFDAARQQLMRLVEAMRPGERVAIITAANPARSMSSTMITDGFAAMRAAERVEPTWAAKDLDGAIRAANEALGLREGAEPREVVILTDLAGMGDADRRDAAKIEDVDRIVVVNAGGDSRENIAITQLAPANQLMGRGMPVRISAEVTNFGLTEQTDVSVAFTVDQGKETVRRIDRLAPRGRGRVDMDFVPRQAGGHSIVARLTAGGADVLAEDNRRDLALEIREGISVLLVEGRWNAPRVEQELFYFQTALESRAADDEQSGFRVRQISATQLGDELLQGYDVVVLGNVKELEKGAQSLLQRFAESGGGVVAFLGDRVEPAEYAGWKLMPVRPLAIAKEDDLQTRLSIKMDDYESPILADFLGQQRSLLGSAMVGAYWTISPESISSNARVLLRLTNGEPLALTAEFGRGRTIVWLSSADLNWSNLPAKPDYVPLMLNIASYAAGDSSAGRNVRVGEWIGNVLKSAGPCEVLRADKSTDRLEPGDRPANRRYEKTDVPGIYQFRCGEQTVLASVNVDAAGSDLRPAAREQVRAAWTDRAIVVKDYVAEAQMLDTRGGAEPGALLAVGLLILLGCESMMAHRFGYRS